MPSNTLNAETLASLKEYADPDDPAFLRELVAAFLSDTETRIAAAREAHKTGDTQALGRLLHTIRGSSLNIGADGMASLAQALEHECKQGRLPEAANLEECGKELRVLQAALTAWLGGTPA
jgi:HPt (histidine-containing phosphotransfer) domain-containing protein